MTNNKEVAVVPKKANQSMVRHIPPAGEYVTPAADVVETPGAFVLHIDIPGAAKGSIHVSIERDTLTLSAPITQHHKENATLLHRELRPLTYHRVFNLGDGIDRNSVEANYEYGVLTVTLQKKEQLRPREIPIH